MAGTAHDHHHGEMEISEQKSTFSLFMNLTKWGSLAVAVIVLWLTMWFSTDAGFFGATLAALVLLVVGWFLLKKKPDSDRPH